MQGPAITTNLDQFHEAKYENKVLLLHKSDDQGTNFKYPYKRKNSPETSGYTFSIYDLTNQLGFMLSLQIPLSLTSKKLC
jgi:hypothetical protein